MFGEGLIPYKNLWTFFMFVCKQWGSSELALIVSPHAVVYFYIFF